MTSIDGDFENASLGQVTRFSDTWYHIGLRPDTAYWTHFRVRGCKGKEITFTLTYTERMHSNRWGTVESTNPERPDHTCRNPYLSYDGETWQHFDHAKRYVTVPHTVCFRHRFEDDEAFVCYTIPYTYADLNRYLDRIRDHPRITVEILGQTTDGHDLPMISVGTNPDADELVGLICREDSDEPTSNFALEGMIGRLMEGGEVIDAMLERCQFRIVPMVAIDAVVIGSPYGGPWDVMTRRWLDDPPLPEIAAIKAQVRTWMDTRRVRLLGKLHGGQTFDNPPVWDFRVFDHALRKLIPKSVPAVPDPVWNPYLHDAVPWVRQLTIFETHLQQEYDFWNFFSTHTNGRDPSNLREQGGRFADLLAKFVLGAES